MRLIISYDISDTRLRNKVSKILSEFGERVQFSVFECSLTHDQYINLRNRLVAESLLKRRKQYKIYFYEISSTSTGRIKRVGPKPVLDEDVLIV